MQESNFSGVLINKLFSEPGTFRLRADSQNHYAKRQLDHLAPTNNIMIKLPNK